MSDKNICNICGANYEYINGRWKCPACGSYKQEEITNEETNLLYNAQQKLRTVDFDEAEKLYDDFIERYPYNPYGYWGRLCAKYGIKFETDTNGSQKPTCFVQMAKITDNNDYKKALELSSYENRAIYEQYGIYLDNALVKYKEIVKTIKPYDVFICYKQTANDRNAFTPEAKWARTIYKKLTELDFNVFFAEECLGDSNFEYEPHIFAAIQKSKIMFVLGSSIENLNSTWVKNEWKRFLKLQETSYPKTVRLVSNGINHNDLPKGLREIKTQDIDINDGEWILKVINATKATFISNTKININDKGNQPISNKNENVKYYENTIAVNQKTFKKNDDNSYKSKQKIVIDEEKFTRERITKKSGKAMIIIGIICLSLSFLLTSTEGNFSVLLFLFGFTFLIIGIVRKAKTKICKYCGSRIKKTATFCTNCGNRVDEIRKNANVSQHITNNTNMYISEDEKVCNKWLSLVLCLYLGPFGVHKFYEGNAKKGILYLCTFGLFGFGWIIDIFTILLKPNPYKVFKK